MKDYLCQFAFQIYPYIVVGVFFIGSWARFDRSMYTWRTGSSQMLSKQGMGWGSNLFHVGIIAILAAHFVGLLTPASVYSAFISPAQKQMLAMVAGGIFGLMCLIGLLILLARRLTNPRVRATGTTSDTVVLVLLLAQLLLGLCTIVVSAGHLDGHVMEALAEWVQRIVTFRANNSYTLIADVSWVYKLHLLLGMTLFLIAPFTRLVHVWSIPFSYLWRPYQIVRRRTATLLYGPRSNTQ
jgi:nitrate reductase gamma subunit